MSYILVTPIKNEENSLPEVIDAIVHQSIKPNLWVIVDDGSTDKSTEIIEKAEIKYEWIKSIRLPEHPRDIYIHYAYICKIGFDFAFEYCNKYKIIFQYIGLLDGDTIVEEKYFEKLLMKFQNDSKLGIASGGIYYKKKNFLVYENSSDDFPRGTGRVWTNQCFFDTGGYLMDRAMHTISNVCAELRGYKTKQFREIIAIETRKTSSVGGFWKSKIKAGGLAYYLYKRPIIVLLNVVYSSCKYPFYLGIAYLIGYLIEFINNNDRISNHEIALYFSRQKISIVLNSLL